MTKKLKDNKTLGYTVHQAQTQSGVGYSYIIWKDGEAVHQPALVKRTEATAQRAAQKKIAELYPAAAA